MKVERRPTKTGTHTYDTVPYYRKVFRERGLSPSDIKSVDDLVKLPVLTKADIRNIFSDLVSRGFLKNRLISYQSLKEIK
jgi:phenylacetate-CoA ligase